MQARRWRLSKAPIDVCKNANRKNGNSNKRRYATIGVSLGMGHGDFRKGAALLLHGECK